MEANSPTKTACPFGKGSVHNIHRCVHDGLIESYPIVFPFIQSSVGSTPQSQEGRSNASVVALMDSTETCRSYANYTRTGFFNDLLTVPWDDVLKKENVNDAWEL